MLKNECIKVMTNRLFLIFTVFLLALNCGYLYWSNAIATDGSAASPAEYNNLCEQLENAAGLQQLSIVQEKMGQMEEQLLYVDGADYAQMEEYFADLRLYQELEEELRSVNGYAAGIGNLLSRAEKQMKRNVDQGTYQEAVKTIEAYSGLEDVKTGFFPRRGIRAYVERPVTDLCVLSEMLFTVFLITTAERQKQLSILSKTTRYGRKRHILVKAAALGILTAVLAVVFHGASLMVIDRIYPFGDLGTAVQSVYPFCYLRVSVGGFLGIFFLTKLLFYCFCVLCFLLICSAFRKSIAVLGVIFAVGGVSAALFFTVSPTSRLWALYEWNLISLSRTENLLCRLDWFTLGSFVCNKIWVYIGVLTVLGAVLLSVSMAVYDRQEERECPERQRLLPTGRSVCHVRLFAHELHKVFGMQRIALLLVLAGAVSLLTFEPADEGYTAYQEIVYNHLAQDMEGYYSRELSERIKDMYGNVQAARPERQGESGEEPLSAVDRAVEQLYQYGSYLEGKPGSYFIHNKGYVILTGGDWTANRRHAVMLMLSAAFLIAASVLAVSVDYQNGEIRLVCATAGGRKYYWLYKMMIGLMLTGIIAAVFWIPELADIFSSYGCAYIMAPAYSLEHLAEVNPGISILMYILLGYGKRLLFLLGAAGFSFWLETRLRSNILTIAFALAVTELPLMICLLVM